MSVSAAFRGVTFQGICLSWDREAFAARSDVSEVFGLHGATQITGGIGAQSIELLLWLTGFASAAAIETYVANTIRPLLEKTGTISLTGSVALTRTDCCLMSVAYSFVHEEQRGPLANNPQLPLAPWTDHAKLSFRKLR